MFFTDINIDDSIVIDGGRIRIHFCKVKNTDRFRIGIDADISIPVERIEGGRSRFHLARKNVNDSNKKA